MAENVALAANFVQNDGTGIERISEGSHSH